MSGYTSDVKPRPFLTGAKVQGEHRCVYPARCWQGYVGKPHEDVQEIGVARRWLVKVAAPTVLRHCITGGRSANMPTQSGRPVKCYHKAGEWLEIPGCPAT
jgi:hypothetical protein